METLSWLLIVIGIALLGALLGGLVDILRLLRAINDQLSLQVEAFKDSSKEQTDALENQHDVHKAVLSEVQAVMQAVKELTEVVQWFREDMEKVGSNLDEKLDRIYGQLDPSSPHSPWYDPAKDPGSDLYMGDEP